MISYAPWDLLIVAVYDVKASAEVEGKNRKKFMHPIELRTTWTLEKVISFASWDFLIINNCDVKAYAD